MICPMTRRNNLWDFLLGLDEASRKALFAHCVSLTPQRGDRALEQAATGAGACRGARQDASVRHGDGWLVAHGRHFSDVLTKARILQAVREARGEDSAQLIDHMKKDIMAREAARLLEGSNWLPEPLRLAGDDVADPVERHRRNDG